MKGFKPLLKLNLQHFAETPVEPSNAPPTQPTVVNEPQVQVPQQQAPQAPQAPQEPININELVNNISSRIDQTLNQRLAPIEQRINQPAPMTQEQIEAKNEEIRQQFENDPAGFVKQIQEQAKTQAMSEIKTQYDPLIQKTEELNNRLTWQDNVRGFLASNPQAQDYMPQITQVIRENPSLLNTTNPLDIAYKTVISNSLIGNGGNMIDGILGNEDLKSQLLKNPQLKEAIIQEYQQGLNSGTQQGLPPLMGNNQTGTQIPASSGEFPKNLNEAKQAAIRRMQGFQNN